MNCTQRPFACIALIAVTFAALILSCDGTTSSESTAATGASSSNAPSTAPPTPASAPISATVQREETSSDGTYRVAWEPVGGVIPEADPFAVRFTVTRVDAQPLDANVRASIDAEMPHHGHGMNLTPTVVRNDDGSFVATGMLLHMSGRWVMSIDVQEHGVTERTQWYVDLE